MQVFIVDSPLYTAQILDKRRLNKQIIECKQILDAIRGEGKGWFNHPIVKMYKNHDKWLQIYMWILQEWSLEKSDLLMLMHMNQWCIDNKPDFLTEEYFHQMKRRLYTKDKEHYNMWGELEETNINMYFVDGEWRYYKNGKQIKDYGEPKLI